MDTENLKKSIESNYSINVKSLEKVKNSYKLESDILDISILFYLQLSIYKKGALVKFPLY